MSTNLAADEDILGVSHVTYIVFLQPEYMVCVCVTLIVAILAHTTELYHC